MRTDAAAKNRLVRAQLHPAAFNGDERMVQMLLKETDMKVRDKSEWAALYWVAENGHDMVARLFLE